MIAGKEEEETVAFEVSGGEEFVEEDFGDFVFGWLAIMGDVAGGEDDVGSAAVVAIVGDGFDEGAQDDVAVIGVTASDVEVGDMKPGELHRVEGNKSQARAPPGKAASRQECPPYAMAA